MVSVYIETYGCPSNRFDTEVMLGLLRSEGFEIVYGVEQADIIILNTCAVKKPTEDRMVSRILKLRATGKPVIIAGCLPRINLNLLKEVYPEFPAVIDPRSVDKVGEAVKQVLSGRKGLIFFSDKPPPKMKLPRLRLSKVTEVVHVAEGCRFKCSYCCVRFARGRLYSYPLGDIVRTVKEAVKSGVKEIWLTGQDLGAYGLDRGYRLTDLVRKILELPLQGFKLRIGMINPCYARAMIKDLIEFYKDPRVYRFLHVPVQSGSNKVLKDMRRPYKAEFFEEIVEKVTQEIPDITIATDIIVGYPTEEEEDFKLTVELIKKTKPDVVNISRFMPRPGTEAAKLKQLDPRIVKKRSSLLSRVCEQISLDKKRRFIGLKEEVLVVGGAKKAGMMARSPSYKPVLIFSKVEPGKFLRVRYVDAKPRYLVGEPS